MEIFFSLYSKQKEFPRLHFCKSLIPNFSLFSCITGVTWLQKTSHHFKWYRTSALPCLVPHQELGTGERSSKNDLPTRVGASTDIKLLLKTKLSM